MRNEKLAKIFLLVSSFVFMVWGVVGIIYQSVLFSNGKLEQAEMFGGVFTIVTAIIEVLCCSAAILYIKKEGEFINIFAMVFSILLAIIAIANIFIFGLLIYGVTKGGNLNSLDWFNWVNFFIVLICASFYIIGCYSIAKIRKNLEEDKKYNSRNYR